MAARIVHLSDLHLGEEGDESWQAFREVTQAVQQNPLLTPISAVIVSGDLGNHPNKKQFALIKTRLEELCEGCGLDPAQHLVIIPGNHDYRFYGNLFAWIQFPGAFNQVFRDWNKPQYLKLTDGQEVAIFSFDSNTSRSGFSFARGCIGADELDRFQTDYTACAAANPSFARAFKIAVTHHHPLPIAAAEADEVSDAFLGLEDAGTFLRELVRRRHGIDLVLHGHKHYPAFGRVKIFTSTFGEREIGILAAGSACKKDGAPRGNSFNVLSFEEGQVRAERWFRDVGSFDREPVVYDVFSYGAARDRAFENFCRDPDVQGVRLRREVHIFEIGEYGDCQRETHYEGLTVFENNKPLEEIVLRKKTRVGQFANITILGQPAVTALRWVPDPGADRRHLRGKIAFEPPVHARPANDPVRAEEFSFRLAYRVFNAFAMNAEQAARMYGRENENGPSDREWISVHIIRPLEVLEIEVKFPSTVNLPAFRVEVRKEVAPLAGAGAATEENEPTGIHNVREEEEARRHLMVSKDMVSLKIAKPLAGHRYGFSWQLATGESRSSQLLRGDAIYLRKELLAIDTRHREDNALQPALRKAREQIYQVYGATGDRLTDYELAIWVFDEQKRHLRCVAGVFDTAYWDYTLREGEGIAGRAHKQNTLICYVRNKIRPGEDYIAPPPDGCRPPEILLVLPLRYPLTADASGIVGLLALSITSPACKLLETEMEETDYRPLTKYLYTECYEKDILRQMLPEPPLSAPTLSL